MPSIEPEGYRRRMPPTLRRRSRGGSARGGCWAGLGRLLLRPWVSGRERVAGERRSGGGLQPRLVPRRPARACSRRGGSFASWGRRSSSACRCSGAPCSPAAWCPCAGGAGRRARSAPRSNICQSGGLLRHLPGGDAAPRDGARAPALGRGADRPARPGSRSSPSAIGGHDPVSRACVRARRGAAARPRATRGR